MTSLIRSTICSTVVVLVAAAQPVHALMTEIASPARFIVIADDDAYTTGTRAMDENRWQDAVSAFDKVINEKGKRFDAALYWKAYSLNKLGKTQLATATCDQLHSQFADSPWNKDCNAISVDVQVDPKIMAADQTNLKMLALNSLLNRDPTTALPLLRGILSGNQPLSVKKHALFVLAQSKSPEAEAILHDAALGKLDPQLQEQAIQAMAVFQGKRANDMLAEVYRTTTDSKIKNSIISAMFITKDAPRMVEMARNEKDLELKRRIVSELALMNDKAATDYMMELLK